MAKVVKAVSNDFPEHVKPNVKDRFLEETK